MDNSQSIRKWTDVRDLVVIAIDTGSKIGTVDDFYFDPTVDPKACPIRALRIKTGMFGHRALPSSAITAIGQSAVTIPDEQALRQEKEDALLSSLPLGHNLLAYKVLSESGTLVGTIGNILLDVGTPAYLRVITFEMAGGLLDRITGKYPTFNASSVIRYGQDVIVISDAAAVALSK